MEGFCTVNGDVRWPAEPLFLEGKRLVTTSKNRLTAQSGHPAERDQLPVLGFWSLEDAEVAAGTRSPACLPV